MYGHNRQQQPHYDKINECCEKLTPSNENFRHLLSKMLQQNNKSTKKLKANCITQEKKLHSSSIEGFYFNFNILPNTGFHLTLHFQFSYLFPLELNCTITNLQHLNVRIDYDNIAFKTKQTNTGTRK